MLTLIIGRAGTGKTAFVMNEIKRRMDAGETGLILLVPEQYSHDAERQLCAVCEDRLSLHGEALSFSRLASRVFAETGGAAEKPLDAGGLILVMHRALEVVEKQLRVFGSRGIKTELLEKLLAAVREFKSFNITPDRLLELSERAAYGASAPLYDKLHDLSLIFGAFEAFNAGCGIDPADKLALLANQLADSTAGDTGGFYFDGFNDFTVQEMCVIEELLKKNTEISVCLTCAGLDNDEEVFALPRKTASRLLKLADDYSAETKIVIINKENGEKAETLNFLEEHLFGYGAAEYTGGEREVFVYAAPTPYKECEFAAYKTLELVRSGCRFRDIAVMSRDWEQYGTICENVFEKYGVPYFGGGRADILQKPPAALIDAALEIAVSGWEYKAVFKYLKTGLTGLAAEDCAELENYVLKWNIRGPAWTRKGEWTLPPSGYGGVSDESALSRINELRRTITEPLTGLSDGIKGLSGADEKLRALYNFFINIGLPERLEKKAEILSSRGEQRLAEEYVQLWDIIKNAMEQFHTILGGTNANTEPCRLSAVEFRRLFTLVLSQYSVGVIPVALDRTALGDMAMSRRRDLKHLIILGASDGNLPMPPSGGGILSQAEREELACLGEDMPSGREEQLCRELNIVYSAVTLPSRSLYITYPASGNSRPSFIVKRIRSMFKNCDITLREEDLMAAAPAPCFELASIAGNTNNTPLAAAARVYFESMSDEAARRLYDTDKSLRERRARLSPELAERLYGRNLSLSASRVDKYYECPFAYFLQSGLKLKPRLPAGFDAPDAGLFTHYILENVSREIKASVGYKNAEEGFINDLTVRFIKDYIRNVLYSFEGANERFKYLFNRMAEDTRSVVFDMLDELKRSDFEPLDFELDFAKLPEPDGASNRLRGIIDRVDGWTHNGTLYLRVVDYKTGKKPFSLSDIVHGMGMQMLIYLFELERRGGTRYGTQTVPAGVLYIPAREIIVKASRNASDEEITRLRERELRRSGLILNNHAVIEAMENGDTKRFLPVKPDKEGGFSGESVANAMQFSKLAEHVSAKLEEARSGILAGAVDCAPFYKSPVENACLYCEYSAACMFCEENGDSRRYIQKIKPGEIWERIEKRDGK